MIMTDTTCNCAAEVLGNNWHTPGCPLNQPTEPRTTGVNRDYADKIAKMLAQAESVAGTPEADAFIARATQLMMKYQIDEAMIAAARGLQSAKEEIIEVTVPFTGVLQKNTMNIAFAVIRANGLQGFYSTHAYSNPKRVDVHVIGYESDVRNAEMLITSLNIQCATALGKWWKSEGDASYGWNKGASFRAKREFVLAYASAVGHKMRAAVKDAEKDAAVSYGRTNGTTEGVGSMSVELVLRDRRESVKDWFDSTYGGSLKSTKSRIQRGGASAAVAGSTAGHAANIGGTAVGGSRKSIGH
jgi:hypothetical protein